jgi:hypothetical protein
VGETSASGNESSDGNNLTPFERFERLYQADRAGAKVRGRSSTGQAQAPPSPPHFRLNRRATTSTWSISALGASTMSSPFDALWRVVPVPVEAFTAVGMMQSSCEVAMVADGVRAAVRLREFRSARLFRRQVAADGGRCARV